MNIDVNVHAASFDQAKPAEEFDTRPSNDPLGLDGVFIFMYYYPLSCEVRFLHTLTPEMSALDLLAIGRTDYERIYAEEDAAVGNPGPIPGMLNRAKSAGPYGIWGHSFSDLYFEGISIVNDQIKFSMGS